MNRVATALNTFLYESNPLIRSWIRHQYLKPVFPLVLSLWWFGVLQTVLNYNHQASNYLHSQFEDNSCIILRNEKQPTFSFDMRSCDDLEMSSQFFVQTTWGREIRSVNCTMSPNFFYTSSPYDNFQNYWPIQFFLTIVGPLVNTYYIAEVVYLSGYDLLVMEPYHGNSVRTSNVVLRTGWLWCWNRLFTYNRVNENDIELPGVRLPLNGVVAAFAAILALVVTVLTVFPGNNSARCTFAPNTQEAVAIVYICGVAIVTSSGLFAYYNYTRLFSLGSLETIAVHNRKTFLTRRFKELSSLHQRNPLDFLALIPGIAIVYACAGIFSCIMMAFMLFSLVIKLILGLLWLLLGGGWCCRVPSYNFGDKFLWLGAVSTRITVAAVSVFFVKCNDSDEGIVDCLRESEEWNFVASAGYQAPAVGDHIDDQINAEQV